MTAHCLIIAHKGYSARYPESTRICYEAAISAGADVLEADVRTTRDGVNVVKHERTLADLTDVSGDVGDYTLAELRDLDFGVHFDARFSGEQILTLDGLLDLVQPHEVGLCIELKEIEAGDRPGCGDDIVTQLRERGLLHRTVINVRHAESSRRLGALEPRLRLSLDAPLPHWGSVADFAAIAADLAASRAHIVECEYRYLTPDLLRACQRIGYPVWAWTVNRREDMLRLLDWGIDGILTDDPALLRAVAGR